jgi:hypothetical protein
MPVLLIALISLAVIGGVSAGIAHWLDRRHEECLEPEGECLGLQEGECFTAVPLLAAFEPDYAILWETQVPALKLIASGGQIGLPKYRLSACYANSAHRYPELYDGCSFQRWVEFLAREHLIVLIRGRIVLTAEGGDFLRYLTSRRDLLRYSDRITPSAT